MQLTDLVVRLLVGAVHTGFQHEYSYRTLANKLRAEVRSA